MRNRSAIALGLLVSVVLAAPAPAYAALVSVGSPLAQPAEFKPAMFNQVGTVVNTRFVKGGNVLSPVAGVVVSWQTLDAEGGPFRLRVLQPGVPPIFTAIATSPSVEGTGGLQLHSLPAPIPIAAGQTVAIDNSNKSDKLGVTGDTVGAEFAVAIPPLVDGAPTPLKFEPDDYIQEVGFNAQILPAPVLTGLSKTKGSIKGGTAVVITGTDLGGASAVSFGSVAAKRFTVESDSQVTAIAPPTRTAAKVPVSVTTIAGSAGSVQKFAYEACKVPALKDKKLKKAKKRLRKAGCRIGKVKLTGDVTKKSGVVVKQWKKAGRPLAPNTKVDVTLG